MTKLLIDFNRDRESVSIWNARHGNYRLLMVRLRDGRATQAEMAIAADIIEGKISRKRGRQINADGFDRAMDIETFVSSLIRDGYKKDAAVKAAEAKFKLSKTRVYEALKQVAHAQEIHDNIAREEFGDPDDFG